MDPPKTPIANRLTSTKIIIPPSPLMKNLGYGTGVTVYKLDRSPASNKVQSPWAIKKVSKRNDNKLITKRLYDEASILKKLNHPNIIGFRAFTQDCYGKVCLAMEVCSSSLGDLIETRYEDGLLAFEPNYILKFAVDIAKALDYLHNKALIAHCDIKSYNVLVEGDFEICKLCDFGVALPLNSKDKTAGVQCMHGTAPWMAPETIKQDIVTDKSDIYSYGLVIWEMLALVPPPLQDESSLDNIDISLDADSSYFDSEDTSISEMNQSNLNIRRIGSRPELPPQEFGDEYNYVLELYYCCTEEDANLRPKASDLVLITTKMQKELVEKIKFCTTDL